MARLHHCPCKGAGRDKNTLTLIQMRRGLNSRLGTVTRVSVCVEGWWEGGYCHTLFGLSVSRSIVVGVGWPVDWPVGWLVFWLVGCLVD